jgi:hypothetical protein
MAFLYQQERFFALVLRRLAVRLHDGRTTRAGTPPLVLIGLQPLFLFALSIFYHSTPGTYDDAAAAIMRHI